MKIHGVVVASSLFFFVFLAVAFGNSKKRNSKFYFRSHAASMNEKLSALPYSVWSMMPDHYYPSIEYKMSQLLHQNCDQNHYEIITYNETGDSSNPKVDPFTFARDNTVQIHVLLRSPHTTLFRFWQDMLPPRQMRVDHEFCLSALAKKQKSLLRNTVGCNTPHLLPPAHPRCQGALLTQHCFESSLSTNSSSSLASAPGSDDVTKRYILKEADHSSWPSPPKPYLIRVKNALVNSCGHINLDCGFLQTNVNCRAPGDHAYANAFKTTCPSNTDLLKSFHTVGEMTTPSYLPTNCSQNEPFRQYRIRSVSRVMVLAQIDDTHIYHTHIEIAPRVVYFIDWVRRYPDMMLLFGCDRVNKDSRQTRRILHSGKQNLIRILTPLYPDIDWERRVIVQEHVFAREVFLPMEGGCQDPVYNTWMALHMRQLYLQRLLSPEKSTTSSNNNNKNNNFLTDSSIQPPMHMLRPAVFLDRTVAFYKSLLQPLQSQPSEDTLQTKTDTREATFPPIVPITRLEQHEQAFRSFYHPPATAAEAAVATHMTYRRKPVLTLLKRSANSQFTRNSADLVRAWTDSFAMELLHNLTLAFPQYEVRLFSDRNVSLLTCFLCQVQAMYETDVLVGIHGAGLGMALYMPPTSVMIEIAPYPNDGRLMLGGGPFSRVAALMSHQYYAHFIPYPEFVWETRTKTSRFDGQRLIGNMARFLRSIDHL